jgi:pimeloyl-ACP methyl ester carboxylesterase
VPRPALAAALALVLLVGACSDGRDGAATASTAADPASSAPPIAPSTSTTPTTDAPAPGFVPGPLAWEGCGRGLECATLTVPLDHDRPDGPTTEVAVARRPARDADGRIGVLLVNPGGPGASGISFIEGGPPVAGLDERFDVVAWDPRGVDDSGGLGCRDGVGAFRGLDPSPDDAAEQSALDASAAVIAADCTGTGAPAAELAANLDSTVAARDLDVLRRALGEEQVSFLGYSYGTLIALEYLRTYPDRVRALALDGVVDPAQTLGDLLTDQTVAIDRLVAEGLSVCAAEGRCVLDDPAAAYDDLAARVEVEALPSRAGDAIGPGRLAFAAIAATYGADGIERLGDALADGVQGDGTALARLADSYAIDDDGFVAYVATLCVDGPHPDGAEEAAAFAARLAARSPRFGAAIANEVLPCAFWGVEPGRDPAPLATTGAGPPVLVIGTTGDGATPYATAERVATVLAGSVLLTYDGLGHTASTGDACVADAVRATLVDLELPTLGTVCQG